MSDLDKLEKKYEKGDKTKDIRQSIAKLKETPSNPDTKKSFESRKETLDSVIRAAKQATAGFKSQWSGLDEEGKVGMGKGTPGIYYNTVAIPAIAGVVDEKYAPDFAVEADKKAGKIKEAVRKDMGINEPKGALEHFAYAGGEMLGQLPVPGALMNKIIGGAKKMGMAGKIAAAPIEYLSPTVDPRTINYGIGTTFGGTMGTVGEALSEEDPVKKALGGLIQKYEDGGKVGKVATFFSAVDKAINTLKQKKGTGEQILKQLETTPGIKPEELESRAIKQKLQSSPKITQEELQKTIKANKPPIPKRIKLGQGVDPEWQPSLEKRFQNALEELNIQPVVSPNDGKALGFYHSETGEILSASDVRNMEPHELGIPVHPETGKLDPEDAYLLQNVRRAAVEAEEQFDLALEQTRTKFGQYSKSKGQNNYREILLQNQEDKVPGAGAMSQRIDDLIKSNPATEEEAAAINKEIDTLLDRLSMTRQQFTASHYDQPDVLAHYRVSDMTGPNGEKVLYVDEIQSDWHQKGRDARKAQIKEQLKAERADIHRQAGEQLEREVGNTDLTVPNEIRFKKIQNALIKERKAQLEREIPEEAGYRTAEDSQKLAELNGRVKRIRDEGLSYNEIQEYFKPGNIVSGYGSQDKVLSFNSGENSPAFKIAYERKLQQAMSAGVGEDVAANWAKKKALDEVRDNWSVTVVEVDPRTGEPKKGAQPRTHVTSPESEIKNQLIQEAVKIERKVPDAPFKKNWHEIAVKDILDLAAKEGYDKVAFSPGIEQINRYSQNLRQAVDSIEFSPTADGHLLVQGRKGDRTVFDGKVLDDTFVSGAAEGKTLSEVFGSQIAKDIEAQAQTLASQVGPETKKITPFGRQPMPEMSAPVGKIQGENLTIGGEGMKSFYDQRLPSFVKNYAGKEFKAPTGYMEFDNPALAKAPTRQQILDEGERIFNADDDEFMERLMDRAHTEATRRVEAQGLREADDPEHFSDHVFNILDDVQDSLHDTVLIELAKERLMANMGKGEKVKAFSVDVTPQMKEKITTEGQKLFAATPAIGLGAAQLPQQMMPAGEPVKEEQPKDPPTAPQGFQEGGKIGKVKEVFSLIGSKIRSGQPIEVEAFHGSPTTGIEKFKESPPAASKGLADSKAGAFWATANREQAKEYALGKTMENQFPSKEKGSKQGEVYDILASLKNPLVLWDDHYLPWDKNHAASVDSPYTRKFALEYAKKNGHDGVVFANKSGKKREVSSFEVAVLPDKQGEYPGVIKKDRQEPPEEPQGFQEGGRVGKLKEASEKVLRVLHGGPSRIRLDREKNLDVTTDQGYAIKRAQDKMSQMGQVGPPMVNKFDVPAAKMLRFEETYSPEDVKLMRRFFNKLPEGKPMTGEEIYDAAQGKDFVMEGIAKAGGLSGYERPAGGSGGVGNWYRVTDQEALTRKARGGLMQYSDGGKVDLAKRGLLGLRNLFTTPTQNLPAVIKPEAKSPLASIAQTPVSRRDILKQATARTLGRALPEGVGELAAGQVAKSVVKKIADPIDPVSIIGKLAPLTQKDIGRILERAKDPKYEIYTPEDIHDFMEYFGGSEYIDKQLMRQINKKNYGLTRKQFNEMLENSMDDDEVLKDAFDDRSAKEYQKVVDMIQQQILPDYEP